MKAIRLIIVLLSTAVPVLGQAPEIEWFKEYYINDAGAEVWGMEETADGGFILTGMCHAAPNFYDVLLVKTDQNGDTLWIRNFGGVSVDKGRSVRQTTDGGYIITGFTSSFGAGGEDLYLIKTDSLGDALWTRTFGGAGDEEGRCVEIADDEGYIITGWSSSFSNGSDDIYVIRTDAQGDSVWANVYGRAYDDRGWSIRRAPGNSCVVAGWSSRATYADIYFLSIDSLGTEIAHRIYGGADTDDEGRAILNLGDDGNILAGKLDYGYDARPCLIRMDAAGDSIWQRGYGFEGIAHALESTSDGGYIVGSYDPAGHRNIFLMKVNARGDSLWMKRIELESVGALRAITQTFDGGYAIAGYDSYRIFLIKLASEQTSTDDKREIPAKFALGQNHPNPFNSSTSMSYRLAEPGFVSIRIYNITGQLVDTILEAKQESGEHAITWDASAFPSGVYLARMEAGGDSQAAKMILLK